jgi:AcrR family transcriptional regulator
MTGRRRADGTLIAALAGGATVRAAARRAGISEATVYRRLRDPEFCQQVTAARADLIEGAMGRTARSMSAAASTLRKLLKAPSDAVKLGAARALLEHGIKLRDSVDHERRLQALEQREQGRRR